MVSSVVTTISTIPFTTTTTTITTTTINTTNNNNSTRSIYHTSLPCHPLLRPPLHHHNTTDNKDWSPHSCTTPPFAPHITTVSTAGHKMHTILMHAHTHARENNHSHGDEDNTERHNTDQRNTTVCIAAPPTATHRRKH
ncbi:hypothetical protein E2C01_037054 [Portunus trituberculatus]|uniref:Uncharacterized protein n=1 Tax=Portunus trituberculatus TaxID=210409 RepID=A0A5B7FEC5_PORTR|nr:hypothetical protein [Portunus trituberculatus]